VLAEKGDCAALILPTDLPLATPAALARLVEARDEAIIVPDEAAAGTNVLRLGRRVLRRFRFVYGPHSYRRHRAEARALGFSLRAVHDPVLKFDVDGPEEYRRWLASA
jgi:2-phospho-L-lactate/phosphoenolpyruvate guanylyltransferase